MKHFFPQLNFLSSALLLTTILFLGSCASTTGASMGKHGNCPCSHKNDCNQKSDCTKNACPTKTNEEKTGDD